MGEGAKPTESEVGGAAGGESPESVHGLAHRSVSSRFFSASASSLSPLGHASPSVFPVIPSLVSWSCRVSIALNQRSLSYHRVLNRFSKLDSVIAVLEDVQL